jgi:predicted DNA-binding transcriptional regulator AlpA
MTASGDILGPVLASALRELVREAVREELREVVRVQAREAVQEARPVSPPPARPVSTNPKRLLGIGELTERLGKDSRTVGRWCRAGRFPAPVYVGTRRAWRLEAVEAWEVEQFSRVPDLDRRRANLRNAGGGA